MPLALFQACAGRQRGQYLRQWYKTWGKYSVFSEQMQKERLYFRNFTLANN
jgi:hypothetical protein